MRCCSEKPDQGKSTRRSSPDFCLRSLSEIPGRKVFYEGLLHLRSHHRECGRTDISTLISALYNEKVLPQNSSEFYDPSEFFYSGKYLRRLPIYFLLDCSRVMRGEAIIAMTEGVQMVHQTLMADPQACETVWMNVIYFSDYVDQTGLVPLDEFAPPTLVVGGARRAMGAALHVLVESIQQDLVLNTPEKRGDFRPLVFMVTGGSSTDHYKYELKRLKSFQGSRKPTILVLTPRNEADTTMLHELSDNVFLMQNITAGDIRGFFRWESGSMITGY